MPGRDLLFELGVEEIPAAFARRALADLAELARAALASARLAGDPAPGVTTAGTPRRLALIVTGLPERQTDVSERVYGPPVSAAYDEAGAPTRAALGFAQRNGVDVAALERSEAPGKKGEYVACTRVEVGKPTRDILPGLLEGLIRALPWPKSMRWAGHEESFVRPVHWIVALYGGEVVPVSFAGVKSGRITRGHRFLAPGTVVLDGDAAAYADALRQAFVIVDPQRRRQTVVAELARAEAELGGTIRPDEALIDEVTFLVEYPVAVAGEFDRGFLEVPEPVIVSAMRAHQRYFAVETATGALMNRFVTIAGGVTRDAAIVRHGNERVLAARLADARFFFREDQKRSLDDWAARLDGVVFQARLGSVGAKARRVGAIAGWLAASCDGVDAATVTRAAALCKADLATHMVGEFPDLQGTMGACYARLAGEPAAVADAIADHYLPRGAGDRLPRTGAGAALAIADRIDTVVGCFAVGLAPTGSADPYGLRRAALGVLGILLDRGWRLPLDALVDEAARALGGVVAVTDAVRADVLEFFRVRLRGLLVESRSLPADCVDAALAAGAADAPDAAARAEAVARLRARPDFTPLATAFKRVANILKGERLDGAPDPARFVADGERRLWTAFGELRARVDRELGGGDYHGALRVLAELKDPVDAFFDAVLVMDKDDAVRENRLALLATINATFTKIADFRQLAV
jgi:glycyl-tRNA synthetase beta chain